MNMSRTHQSHALAFRDHCDYACALTISHESLFSRFRRWMRETFKQGA